MVGRNLREHSDFSRFDVLVPARNVLDLCNFSEVENYLSHHQPDIIIHAAGKVGGIQANMREPVSFLMENMSMGRNIVWAARQTGVKRLINLGSSCMYPRSHDDPLREEMVLSGELEPTNEGYALAKIVTMRLCEYIARENPEYCYKSLIPCNIYGRFDKFDPLNSHLLPSIIHKIHSAKVNGEKSIVIWGDGTARREFMYAGDLADAIVRAVLDYDTLPMAMNIGIGHDYTIDEYYETAAAVMGYKGKFVYDIDKPVGMKRKLVDIEKQKYWGWCAKHSLYEGIKKTYDYYLSLI